MKKSLITILTTSFISSQLASNEIYKTNNHKVEIEVKLQAYINWKGNLTGKQYLEAI